MMRARAGWGVVAVLGLLGIAPAHAQSLRCGGALVTEGDTATSVVQACGAPDFRDVWRATGGLGAIGPPLSEWIYNDGPQALIQTVRFRGDRVVGITPAGYGFDANGLPPSGDCDPGLIQPGMSKYRLLYTCGPPLSRTGGFIAAARVYEPGYSFDLGPYGGQLVYRERWTYNFGDNRLMRDVMLDNARVVDVTLGQRGFDR